MMMSLDGFVAGPEQSAENPYGIGGDAAQRVAPSAQGRPVVTRLIAREELRAAMPPASVTVLDTPVPPPGAPASAPAPSTFPAGEWSSWISRGAPRRVARYG
jgi:hypothetical protein